MATVLTQFLDRCIWTPASGGTGSFVLSAAVTGFQTMSAAGAVNGAVYGYAAQSTDLSQWEVGYGTWTTGTSTLTRTVTFNSLGTAVAVNFTVPPQVMITAIAETLVGFDSGFSYAGSGALTLALGTITANANALTITGTWNNSGVTFDAPLFLNITNTASAGMAGSNPGSELLDLQVGGSSQFAVSYAGVISGGGNNGGGASVAGSAIYVGQFNNGWVGQQSQGYAALGNNNGNTGLSLRNDTMVGWSSSNQLNNTDTTFSRYGAGIVGLSKLGGAGATGLQVYNTVDSYTSPTNYERGVIDWTTTANVLTIGTQAGGTGSARNLAIISASNFIYFGDVPSGSPIASINNNSGRGMQASSAIPIGFTTGTPGSSGNNVGFGLLASLVVGISDGGVNRNGWFNYAGQTRVTSPVTYTSNVTPAVVTGLSVALQAGRTYSFDVYLSFTDAAAGGIQAQMAASGGLTATAIVYDGWIVDSGANGIKGNATSAALGGVVASSTTTGTAGVVRIKGTITVNVAGTLNVFAAQNTSNGTATTIKQGSYMIVFDMP